jgi:hypothetical protein
MSAWLEDLRELTEGVCRCKASNTAKEIGETTAWIKRSTSIAIFRLLWHVSNNAPRAEVKHF